MGAVLLSEIIIKINSAVNELVWGPFMLAIMVGAGVYFSIGTGFMQLFRMKDILKCTLGSLLKKEGNEASKGVSPFAAVSTALAGTMGVGNIAGVAGAIVLGGAGAVFWMWVSAFFGMALKYSEIVLAVKFRKKDKNGQYYGGPMYYIEEGLKCKPLAVIFALCGVAASFGIGNMTQASEISSAVKNIFEINSNAASFKICGINLSVFVGICTAILVGLVIIGGIKRIACVTELIIPLMSALYLLGGLYIILKNYIMIPSALREIITGAFNLRAVGGGIFGAAIINTIKQGVARGVFSNEAGLGSAPMAHAAAEVRDPVEQGMWGMLEVALDTMFSCTVTALVVIIAGQTGLCSIGALTGGELTACAFDALLYGGGKFISFSIIFFALPSIICWSYYGEQCVGYICKNNKNAVLIYKVVFTAFTIVGAAGSLELVWSIGDTLNGMMAIPNLIAVTALSGIVFKTTREYNKTHESDLKKCVKLDRG